MFSRTMDGLKLPDYDCLRVKTIAALWPATINVFQLFEAACIVTHDGRGSVSILTILYLG